MSADHLLGPCSSRALSWAFSLLRHRSAAPDVEERTDEGGVDGLKTSVQECSYMSTKEQDPASLVVSDIVSVVCGVRVAWLGDPPPEAGPLVTPSAWLARGAPEPWKRCLVDAAAASSSAS